MEQLEEPESGDKISGEDEDQAWTKKLKKPRMTMRADEESKSSIKKRLVSSGIRNRVGLGSVRSRLSDVVMDHDDEAVEEMEDDLEAPVPRGDLRAMLKGKGQRQPLANRLGPRDLNMVIHVNRSDHGSEEEEEDQEIEDDQEPVEREEEPEDCEPHERVVSRRPASIVQRPAKKASPEPQKR